MYNSYCCDILTYSSEGSVLQNTLTAAVLVETDKYLKITANHCSNVYMVILGSYNKNEKCKEYMYNQKNKCTNSYAVSMCV